MIRHNVRNTHGRRKGKFTKQIVKEQRDKILAASRKVCQEKEKEDYSSDLQGRRIIELSTLAEELWCSDCNIALSLRNTTAEIMNGLASTLKVTCTLCQRTCFVKTCKAEADKQMFAVNSKAAIGLIDGGIGESHLNTILSALNIPTISPKTLKRYERYVGAAIEEVATESCKTALRMETELSNNASSVQPVSLGNENEDDTILLHNDAVTEKSSLEPSTPVSSLKVSFDAGWQRRGTGHSYNSLSGHSSMIGYHSGKVLSYAVRSKQCRHCAVGHAADDHDCRKNFDASAKAMEPDMAVELIHRNKILTDENANVTVLIGDDDSCTIAAVRRQSAHSIEKWSDFNHAHKAVTNALYSLKLPLKLIEYFSHCFACAVKQNEGHVEKVQSALLNVVPHAFGEHENCTEWCGYKLSGDRYVHANLPNGKPLVDPKLRVSMTALFERFANNSSKLAPCASSQGNESFNSIVSSKNPKFRHYSASESLNFRVAAAVCQKNMGCKYITEIYKTLELSPGTHTLKFREAKDKKRERKAKFSKYVEIKKRRLFAKKQRSSKSSASKKREGITYQTECGLDSFSDSIQNPVQSAPEDYTKSSIIYFDLETSGLSNAAEICQIAACQEDAIFNAYIIPSRGISASASNVTGLKMISGEMFLHDTPLKTVPVRNAFLDFLKFLRHQGSSVVLVAHNGLRFDIPRILNLANELNLTGEFHATVKGFADTLCIFREHLSERVKEKKKFSQQALAEDFLTPEDSQGAHNAVQDVKTLQKLVIVIGVTEQLKQKAKSISQIVNDKKNAAQYVTNKATLDRLNSITNNMKTKIAKAGIDFSILRESFKKSGFEGVKLLLGENVGGRPRVTTSKKIINNLFSEIEKIT